MRRLLQSVFQLAVLAARESLERQRPARAISARAFEALSVVLVHARVSVQREAVQEGTPPPPL